MSSTQVVATRGTVHPVPVGFWVNPNPGNDGTTTSNESSTAVVYLPVLQRVFGTAALDPGQLAVLLPFPFVVWGGDELVRWGRRRRVVGGSEIPHSPLRTTRYTDTPGGRPS